MQNKGRLHHIESIRALAALSVALFHFTNTVHNDTFLISSAGIRNFFTYGAQGVEIFYVISGFIIPYALYHSRYQLKNYFAYLLKRLSRLLPPYYLTITLITLTAFILHTYAWLSGYNVEWRNIAANAVFGVDFIASSETLLQYFPDNRWINPVFETLKVEAQFYIFIGLLFPLFQKKELYLIGSALIFLGIGAASIPDNTVFIHSPYFFLGITSFYIREKGWSLSTRIVFGLCTLSLLFFYVWQDFFAGFLAFALIIWLPTNFRVLRFTGKISYSYYLIHGLAGGQLLYFLRKTAFYHDYPFLMVLFAILFSWIAAFLIYFCIEKPSLSLSKRIKYKD